MKVSETSYTLSIVTEDGTQYDISDFAEDLGWEENEKELALSMHFSVGTDDWKLGSILKIGCLVIVFAYGVEQARAIINRVKVKRTTEGEKKTITAYDELYSFQTSEDQLYFSAGQTTKSIFNQIFEAWGIPAGEYTGADVTHEKLIFRSGSLADICLDILDDAVKKGGVQSILRAREGKIDVVKRGNNKTVYLFDIDDTISVEQETSITDLVTRVKIVGKEDDKEGLPPVEATLNGLTEFGIRQKIYAREKDATTEEAQTAAQAILDEKGQIKTNLTLKTPDVPEMRKGDVVFVHIGAMVAYYFVTGIRHDATTGTMTIDLEQSEVTDAAIEKLAALGVINSPDYWKEHIDDTKYLRGLVDKCAAVITKNGPRCSTVDEAVGVLLAAGIINSPAYWLTMTGNVAHLLMALGGAVSASGAKIDG